MLAHPSLFEVREEIAGTNIQQPTEMVSALKDVLAELRGLDATSERSLLFPNGIDEISLDVKFGPDMEINLTVKGPPAEPG